MNVTADSATLRVAGDHPCLAGHFPGRPIVPAVVILDAVLSAARTLRPGCRAVAVVQAKFQRPLPPDTDATIVLEWRDQTLRFRVASHDADYAAGEFALDRDRRP